MHPNLAVLTVLAILLAGPAAAQSRCGDVRTIAPGETLFAISQDCRISRSRIHALNPDLPDGTAPEAGTELRLAPRRGARNDESGLPPQYKVREGDSAASIADALGISLLELLHRNGNLDPNALAPGQVLEVPDEDRGAPVFAQPLAGPPGTVVTLRAGSLRPGDFVTLGVGASPANWTPLGEARVDADGRLDARAILPETARPGDILAFFVDTDRGAVLKSRDFDVLDAEAPETGEVEIEGRIRRGVECPMLVTPDGDLYGLVSDDKQILPDDYVQISGQRVQMSICNQGIATIDVASMTEIRAPGNLPRDSTAPKPEQVLGAWAPKGGDCGVPAFEISRDGDRIIVKTRLNGAETTGRVAFSGDTTYIAFEMPYQEFGLERRAEGELALIAPAGTSVTIGGVKIEGGDQSFVKCFG